MLDLRYEARDIDQAITSQQKIDHWFDAKTKGLNDIAKAQLKQKWGTMQRVLSSQSGIKAGRLACWRMRARSAAADPSWDAGPSPCQHQSSSAQSTGCAPSSLVQTSGARLTR